jgi:hypothetical protein
MGMYFGIKSTLNLQLISTFTLILIQFYFSMKLRTLNSLLTVNTL